MPNRSFRVINVILKVVIIIAVYQLATRVGATVSASPSVLSPLWPQDSVAFALLLLFGLRYWPAITFASFLNGIFLLHLPLGICLQVPVGKTVAAVFVAYFLNKFLAKKGPLSGVREFYFFILFAVLCGPLINALNVSIAFYFFNGLTFDRFFSFFGNIFAGHACTNLVVAPLLVSLLRSDKSDFRSRHFAEGAAMLTGLTLLSGILFVDWFHLLRPTHFPLEHLVIPFLLWAASRLGPVFTGLGILVVSGFAIASNVLGYNPMFDYSTNPPLLMLQLYLAVTALMIEALCATSMEREEQKAGLETVFRASPVGLALLDKDLRYLQINDVLAAINGVSVAGHLGQTVDEVLPVLAPHIRPMLERILRTGEPVRNIEFKGRVQPNFPELYFLLNYYPVMRDGEPLGIGCAVFDITKRKTAETQLQKHALELEISNRELEQYAYVASHDLQEPLRMISLYLELLEKKYHDQWDDKAKSWMNYIVDGSRRMSRMIQDLLEYSMAGRNLEEPAVTSFNAILEEALRNLEIAIKDSDAKITIGKLPEIRGDRARLVSLFQNLLSNAIKYRNERPLEITVGAQEKDGKWIFSVADNGIGIEQQFVDRVFQIFQRLHSRSEYSGTGIGLSICKKIVESHGGQIWIESTSTVGTTVFFTLPKT